MSKRKLAVIDFCDTIIKGQTTDLFYDYVLKNCGGVMQKIKAGFYKFIGKIFASKPELRQKIKYKGLSGIPYETIRELSVSFVDVVLLKRENSQIVSRMIEHRNNGVDVIIISAGIDLYVEEYAKRYTIPMVIASTLKVNNDKLLGIGYYCYASQKVERLKDVVNLDDYNLQESFAYSDHISDMPLLELTGNSFVVGKKDAPWRKKSWKWIPL